MTRDDMIEQLKLIYDAVCRVSTQYMTPSAMRSNLRSQEALAIAIKELEVTDGRKD